ncbi:extensin-2 [Drosophila teissieri]|uniref:extensin-2 n=1 Tax=Drosophila teissieri TaxID=7243 RepID=UPI001CBA152B|nr:extensin-2 [Drosophila teissieri]
MRTAYLVVLICTSCICACAGDSYSGDIQNSNSVDFGNDSGGYSYSSPPSNSYLPPATPAPEYLPPPNNGYQYNPPPNNNYLPPPNNNYLPPPPEYGPPAGYPSYGPPPPPFYKPAPFIPYQSHESILEKLKSKINLYTLGKILLKLLIFKKIVKFIGLIFLLLVLPKLKNIFKDDMMSGSGESDGMESKLVETDKDKLSQQIEDLYDFVINSIENFEGRSS